MSSQNNCNIVKNRSDEARKHKQSDNQTNWKQTSRLDKLISKIKQSQTAVVSQLSIQHNLQSGFSFDLLFSRRIILHSFNRKCLCAQFFCAIREYCLHYRCANFFTKQSGSYSGLFTTWLIFWPIMFLAPLKPFLNRWCRIPSFQ